ANAERVQSLRAFPEVTVTFTEPNGRKQSGSVNGRLAMERPRSFKLLLKSHVAEEADIGSNEDEFWFWNRRNEEKAVYVCHYSEAGDSPLPGSLQPDWIVEALGLREIPPQDEKRIIVRRGQQPGTLVLTDKRTSPLGETTYKVTVVDEA